MLDRIRRKMFLSLKVMSSSTSSSPNDDNTQLKTTELLDILRKGSSALSRSDVDMDLGTFLKAPIEEILDDSREREGVRDAKLKKEMVSSHDTAEEIDEKTLLDADEEERKLLSGIAQVQSRLFEGKLIKRNQNNHQIAQEWQELQQRARIDRTVVVDGITVIADHMGQTVVRVVFSAGSKMY
jgi:SWI/SNF-related matrix-associated actin-dependent regulator of chromatin subfamily A member 5